MSHYIVASSAWSPAQRLDPSPRLSVSSLFLSSGCAQDSSLARGIRGALVTDRFDIFTLAQLLPRCDKPGWVSRLDVRWERPSFFCPSLSHYNSCGSKLSVASCLPPTCNPQIVIPGTYVFTSTDLSLFSTCLDFLLSLSFLCWIACRVSSSQSLVANIPLLGQVGAQSSREGECAAARRHCFQTCFVSISSFNFLIIFHYAYAFGYIFVNPVFPKSPNPPPLSRFVLFAATLSVCSGCVIYLHHSARWLNLSP